MGVSLLYVQSIALLYGEPRSLDEPLPSPEDGLRTLGEAVVDPGPTPEELAGAGQARPLIARGLRGLSRDHALTVVLRHLAGWSRREIAEVLAVDPLRVSDFERAALRRMREAVGRSP